MQVFFCGKVDQQKSALWSENVESALLFTIAENMLYRMVQTDFVYEGDQSEITS